MADVQDVGGVAYRGSDVGRSESSARIDWFLALVVSITVRGTGVGR